MSDDITEVIRLLADEDAALTLPVASIEDRLLRLAGVEAYRARYREIGHQRVYRMLAMAHEDALWMQTRGGNLEFRRVAADRGINIGYGENPHLPITRLMWSYWGREKDKVTPEEYGREKWLEDPSAGKYARTFRYLERQAVTDKETALVVTEGSTVQAGSGLSKR